MSFLFEPLDPQSIQDEPTSPPVSFWSDVWMRLKTNKLAMTGLIMLGLIITLSIIGPYLTPYAYYETHLPMKNQSPSAAFWLGTDDLGRDIFTRIWWGARISLFVGISAALFDMLIGVLYGAFAAFAGGKTEEFMMRLADVFRAIPSLLITIAFIMIMGPGLWSIVLAMAFSGWVTMARIVRSQIHQCKRMDYIHAAHGFGASRFRILMRHLVPNAMGSIITTVTLTIPSAIFREAFLSFLGLGIQPPLASWGIMAADGLPAMRYFPWRLFTPCFFLSITMLAFNLLGDGLRDALDPRLRK